MVSWLITKTMQSSTNNKNNEEEQNIVKVGNKVIVKTNLEEELRKLTFDEFTCKNMAEHFVGTEQEIFALWKNEDGQEYATVDLCCEIPVQCLEVIK